ncbi:MAG TPA: M20/M25/M40 family metallo-hydrolase [Gaiellaceae bacterium]|nr:M20/M25/M40 family metallo-hydrolase [Gaiellaceae bacterium]
MSEAVDLLLELAAIPSPPGEERAVADVVLRYLRGLGLETDEDDCGPRIGSTAGNIYARLEPTAEGTPLFLCAHMDTVPPDGELEPVVVGGVIRNAGGTILGGDNKAAITAMLEGVRRVVVENVPHAGIELVFTPMEEVGLVGAVAFDHDRLRARVGYVYDQEGAMGEVVLGAPWSKAMDVRFHGRSAHAGMAPEEGRSAIQAAAKAIADLRLGRVDELTTSNVGTITGGTAGNVVPEWCTFSAEARSHDEAKLGELVQEMLDAFSFAATETECDVETTLRKSYDGYRLKRDEPAVALAAAAFARRGFEPRYGLSGGGADANVFNERGRRCVNLSHGVFGFHTPDEHVSVEDLDAMVDVTLALVDAART